MDWDWSKFEGTEPALKYARRDLEIVDAVLKLTPGREAVVQAGGNLGIFPKYLSRFFVSVYTFEPDPDRFKKMTGNAPEQNIIRFQAALGFERTLVSTRRVRRDGSSKIAHEGITHVVAGGFVPTVRVDDLSLPVCDLLYLDLEGFELFALRGARDTLAQCRPTVVVEIGKHSKHYGVQPAEVETFLRVAGYDAVMKAQSDVVFVPKERANDQSR
jgi:FkbM family methyltransferase